MLGEIRRCRVPEPHDFIYVEARKLISKEGENKTVVTRAGKQPGGQDGERGINRVQLVGGVTLLFCCTVQEPQLIITKRILQTCL